MAQTEEPYPKIHRWNERVSRGTSGGMQRNAKASWPGGVEVGSANGANFIMHVRMREGVAAPRRETEAMRRGA